MEGVNDPVTREARVTEIAFMVTADWDNRYHVLMTGLALAIENAYKAGAAGTKGIGLNVPVEQRAQEYAHLKGFIP